MLPDPVLNRYLLALERVVRELLDVYVEQYEEEIIAADRLNLRLRFLKIIKQACLMQSI
jgi:hypothetical protein